MRRDERISTWRMASIVAAAAISPRAPSHGVALTLLHDAATTATASSTSWRPGTGVGCSARPDVGLSTTTAAAAARPISATRDQNANRHVAYCANTPPTAGPSSVAMPHMPESSASARGHSGSGSTEHRHGGRQRAQRRAAAEHRRPQQVGAARPRMLDHLRSHRRPGDRRDDEQRCVPRIEGHAADIVDHARQDGRGQVQIDGVQRHAGSQHQHAQRVSAAKQVKPRGFVCVDRGWTHLALQQRGSVPSRRRAVVPRCDSPLASAESVLHYLGVKIKRVISTSR
ncbi:hypothetical protein COLO4_02186 [Corchorus olitorius]|uniref:Uncharacterized protein n=1 Tax=Corchorus olitorius TaxID=93759 RepID=A0A1R3L1D5_9ROSI|nr:hypothetical protein COLO4_02186 [Corchorus olitorius]